MIGDIFNCVNSCSTMELHSKLIPFITIFSSEKLLNN